MVLNRCDTSINFPGFRCDCDSFNIDEEYQGEHTLTKWVVPELKCSAGFDYKVLKMNVTPDVSPPAKLRYGLNRIMYSYNVQYQEGSSKRKLTKNCSVEIYVKGKLKFVSACIRKTLHISQKEDIAVKFARVNRSKVEQEIRSIIEDFI